MDDVKIVVATHKKSAMPKDEMYLPLHVGAAGKFNTDGSPVDFGYTRDDTGDNISERNANFGTQTGLFWLWKNLNAEYKGLVHYRRYFVGKKVNRNDMLGSVLTYDEIRPLLGKYKVFVPRKRHYYIETLYSHYAHTHDESHLKITRNIIEKKSPDYLIAFDKVMRKRWGYMFNMMILQKDLMDDYCSWLFEILFELYDQVDKSGMSAFDGRFCGRISEIMFDVWIEKRLLGKTLQSSEIKELPYMEDVDWMYKVKAFLSAKFLHKKYRRSS